jgi:acyl carrier protein
MVVKFDPERIKNEVKLLVSEIAKIPVEKIHDNTHLMNELGVDSMMAIEIITSVEKKYRIIVPEEIRSFGSVRDICNAIEQLVER